jgi:hypothetical protein
MRNQLKINQMKGFSNNLFQTSAPAPLTLLSSIDVLSGLTVFGWKQYDFFCRDNFDSRLIASASRLKRYINQIKEGFGPKSRVIKVLTALDRRLSSPPILLLYVSR